MDNLTKRQRRFCMSNIKSKDTKPELIVRAILTDLGLRYRLHVNKLPGKPDIVIPRHKRVIFINGCFWHQHPNCQKKAVPKSNIHYWKIKLLKNVNRQKRDIRAIIKLGWRPTVIWECQTKDNLKLSLRFKRMFFPRV